MGVQGGVDDRAQYFYELDIFMYFKRKISC